MNRRRKEFAILPLQLKDGEYLTIGEDIVIQVFTNSAIRVSVKVPKNMPILRGEVLERTGGERPECVLDAPRRHRQEVVWNRGKTQALNTIRLLLGQMDGADPDVKALRRQLEFIFPPEFAPSETAYAPK